MKEKLILLIPKKSLTYARYLSLTTGVFIDNRKTTEDYRKIFSSEITEEELKKEIKTILIFDHLIHMMSKKGKSFNHRKNQEKYRNLFKNLIDVNSNDINKEKVDIELVDLDNDTKIYDRSITIIIPGIFYEIKESSINENRKDIGKRYKIGELNNNNFFPEDYFKNKLSNGKIINVNINSIEYTKFFNDIKIQGQPLQPGINLMRMRSEKNTPITRAFYSQTVPKEYDEKLNYFSKLILDNEQNKNIETNLDEETKRKISMIKQKILSDTNKNWENSDEEKSFYLKKFKNLTIGEMDGNNFIEMFNRIDYHREFICDYFISHQSRDKMPLVENIIKNIKSEHDKKGLFVNI